MRSVALLLWVIVGASAQSPTWRKVGSSSVELMLASPATGPVDRAWYSADGNILYARTRAGRVFETADFEIWTPSLAAAEPPPVTAPPVARIPEADARVLPAGFGRVYALGRQLFRSEDGGRTWANLTGFKTDSVIGFGQRSIALSPNPDQIVAANDFGVWRSMDGGLSWSGLNQFLPNLDVKRILSAPSGATGARIEVAHMGPMELAPGASVWTPVEDAAYAAETASLSQLTKLLGVEVRSVAVAEKNIYAGTADGRIMLSIDGGASFINIYTSPAGNPVERIWLGGPQVALAALGGNSGPHVLRTTNGGGFWDTLDSNLPNTPVHGIAGDRASGAAYIATGLGVYYARVDLDLAGNRFVNWIKLSDSLPGAATDVHLDSTGLQLYASIEGYGVYAAAAPVRNLRLVNAADFSLRAAAPGGLLSVIGGRVTAARGGNLDYPVLAAGDDASQIQVPFAATGPGVSLALTSRNRQVRVGLLLQPVSPAIFVTSDGVPMLQDAESGLLLDARRAARSGAHLQLLATGLGKVSPDWPTGRPAPLDNAPVVAANVRAFLNGAPVPVTRAALAGGHIGLYSVELQLPAINNSGPAELYITADGVESNRVQILVEQ